MNNLEGKVAVITGASSGIGRAYAHALSAEGVRLVLVGRSRERLGVVANSLPFPAVFLVGDIALAETSEHAVRYALAEFGRLDIVIANAGLYAGGGVEDVAAEEIERIVSVNVFGVMATIRAVLAHFVESRAGDIVVTSSVSGHQDIQWEPVYSATKHAVQAFVHTVRRQLVGTGVRVGAIAPGVVLNELWGLSDADGEVETRIQEGTGIRSEDVADAVLFMLTRPPHITIRDLVILPTNQEI